MYQNLIKLVSVVRTGYCNTMERRWTKGRLIFVCRTLRPSDMNIDFNFVWIVAACAVSEIWTIITCVLLNSNFYRWRDSSPEKYDFHLKTWALKGPITLNTTLIKLNPPCNNIQDSCNGASNSLLNVPIFCSKSSKTLRQEDWVDKYDTYQGECLKTTSHTSWNDYVIHELTTLTNPKSEKVNSPEQYLH